MSNNNNNNSLNFRLLQNKYSLNGTDSMSHYTDEFENNLGKKLTKR